MSADQFPSPQSCTSTPAHSAPVLDYAPTPPPWRRRWFRRIVLPLLLLTLALVGWRVGVPTYHQARYLMIQRACLNHRLPEDRIVYETGLRVEQLLQQKHLYRPTRRTPGWEFYSNRPRDWSPSANYQFPEFDALHNDPQVIRDGDALLFCHVRTTPLGTHRLISLDVFFATTARDQFDLLFKVRSWRPADTKWGSRAVLEFEGWLNSPFGSSIRNYNVGECIRIFAGQPDPAGPSHFTIKAEVNGVERIIDGWLRDPAPGSFNRKAKAKPNVPWVELKPRPLPRPVTRPTASTQP